MRKPQLNFKALGFAALFSIIIVAIGFYINGLYENLAAEVIQTNKVLCEVLATQLYTNAESKFDSLAYDNFFNEGYKNIIITNKVDEQLSRISEKVFSSAKGVEGGFYLLPLSKFQGYAYPTSPPPKPVYGPPPRSYSIIQNQILETIEKDTTITQLHKFDPAIFPLATVAIKVGDQIVGAAWVRTHIERELPQFDLRDILNITAICSLLGFFVALWVSVKQKNRLESIRIDLEKLEDEPNYRLRELPGIFGFITDSINKMVDALQAENDRRKYLEKELHQKDKMASIGKLIAGVAHEVKTPLAIIKTRIQIWQQKLNKNNNTESTDEIISSSSMQLVINEINRLSNLVNRLLIFSKPVADNFTKTNINNLINDVLTFFKTERFTEKAEIIFMPDDNLPEIKIDPNKIEQVMLNIISNAYDAILGTGEIKITTFIEADFVYIKISDNGKGIPEESKSNIFDPFFSTKDTGTGLGLSIAYEIIEAHKGKIEFSSKDAEGSTFTILFPLKQK
jgi:signal transduction histidine kinase